MKVFPLALALALVGSVLPLAAQSPSDEETPSPSPSATPGRERPAADGREAAEPTFWKAELPGGNFLVAHAAIQAVATQQYILDGAARVVEVNVITTGPFQPRFYFVEPLPASALAPAVPGAATAIARAEATAQTLAARVVPGDPPWARVAKSYPTTTHAGTIEFRLETREQLDQLFESAERSWTSRQSEVFTPTGTRPYRPPQPAGSATPSPTPADEI